MDIEKLRSLIEEIENFVDENVLSCKVCFEKLDTFYNLIDEIKDFACESSSHDFVYDQCGYWQHKFCLSCGSAQHKELSKKKCGNLLKCKEPTGRHDG